MTSHPMRVIKGKASSPGARMGEAWLVEHRPIHIEKMKLSSAQSPDIEFERLQRAVSASKKDIERTRDHVLRTLGPDHAAIFEAHLMMLEDPEFLDSMKTKIEFEHANSEWAVNEVAQQFVTLFESMDQEVMRERGADVRDISNRIQLHLMGLKGVDLTLIDRPVVVVAHDLTPSQTAQLDPKLILGIVTDIGGKTSHTAIMSRTLEIPAVLGTSHATEIIESGDKVALDGSTGEVWVSPTQDIVKHIEHLQELEVRERQMIEKMRGLKSITRDNCEIEISGNIGTPKDLPLLKKYDADGVGLFRTEFLFMDRSSMPSEDEQFEAYRTVLKSLNGKRCVIRTLDIGGDKELKYLNIPREDNPFLGERAIRYCLKNPEILKTQLRALVRASEYGKLAIMFPMISNLQELFAAKTILSEVRSEYKGANSIEVGMMIEIPSAAIMADAFAPHIDFFSIGTNDLIQYVCAVDRMNERVSSLYDPYHPAVLRLIRHIAKSGQSHSKWVGMCGEMASQLDFVPFLLGCGITELSMAPPSVLRVRGLVRSLDRTQLDDWVESIASCGDSEHVQAALKNYPRSSQSHFVKESPRAAGIEAKI